MAHPVSEGQFDVLASPDVHCIIEASDFEEVFLLHSERATDEGRGPKRTVVRIVDSLLFMLRHLHPCVSEGNKNTTSVLTLSELRSFPKSIIHLTLEVVAEVVAISYISPLLAESTFC